MLVPLLGILSCEYVFAINICIYGLARRMRYRIVKIQHSGLRTYISVVTFYDLVSVIGDPFILHII